MELHIKGRLLFMRAKLFNMVMDHKFGSTIPNIKASGNMDSNQDKVSKYGKQLIRHTQVAGKTV